MIRRFGVPLVFALTLSAVGVMAQSAAPVADAARRADKDALRVLLKAGADVSAQSGDGMTALHWAAERGDLAMTEMLIFAGANVSSITRIGQYAPVHLASKTGNAPVVRALLKAGASAKMTAVGAVTPLHLAASSGSVETVTALIDAGADVNAKDIEYQQTPLIFAASQGHVAAIDVLVKRGADVNAQTKVVDLARQRALDQAATAMRRRILDAGVAKGTAPTASQEQAAIQASREIQITGKIPEIPQPAAAGGGRGGGGRGGGGGGGGGADPAMAPGASPAPPAGAPGAAGGFGGRAAGGQTATDLQNADGPPAATSAKGGLTALHHAARQGHVKAALSLVQAGADINKKMADGNSPLLVSIINGQFDLAMMLLERGANPNQTTDVLGVTPLWAVINATWQPRTRYPQPQEMDLQKTQYLDVMKKLLEAGADPNARIRVHPWYLVYTGCGNGNCGLTSTVGSTAFWRAAYGTDVEAMRLLMKYGADPNIPTMAAAARGGGAGGGGGGRGGGGAAGGAGGRGGGAGGPGGAADPVQAGTDPIVRAQAPGAGDGSGLPPVPPGGPGVFAIHAAAGVEYGEGFAGNAHRHAPESWLASVKYLVEELGADVNQRDNDGFTPLHHAAARGDNEMILYLVSKGADVKAISRRNNTTADMANGPVSRISPFPDTIALLEKLGSKNNHKCASCVP